MAHRVLFPILLVWLVPFIADAQSFDAELIEAAKNGQTDKVKALLETGADANAKDSNNITALMFAIRSRSTETVKALLDQGADLDARDFTGSPPLIVAAALGYPEIVLALLDASAEINAKNRSGGTALMLAASAGHSETVAALLNAGADANAKAQGGGTTLIAAAFAGHAEIVQALLEAGAGVNDQMDDGGTAVMAAQQGVHTSVVELLKRAGAHGTEWIEQIEGRERLLDFSTIEDQVMMTMVRIQNAQIGYSERNGTFTAHLRDLEEFFPQIETALSSFRQAGYEITYAPEGSTAFSISASPVEWKPGMRSFFIDEVMKIPSHTREARAATAEDPLLELALRPF